MCIDEELLKRKKLVRQMAEEAQEQEIREEEKQSVLDGSVTIYGESFAFARREIETAGISIVMPVIFEELEEEIRRAMYPMGNGPKPVYACDRDLFNIAVNKTAQKVPQENIVEFTNISCQLLECLGPQSKLLKKYTVDLEEMTIGVMEFLTMAMDGRVHRVNCLFPFEDGITLVDFSFFSTVKERIRPIVMEMIHTILFLTGEASE